MKNGSSFQSWSGIVVLSWVVSECAGGDGILEFGGEGADFRLEVGLSGVVVLARVEDAFIVGVSHESDESVDDREESVHLLDVFIDHCIPLV